MDATCFEIIIGKVDDSFCLQDSKLEPIFQPCNIFECAAE
jgi:hypothetical protein